MIQTFIKFWWVIAGCLPLAIYFTYRVINAFKVSVSMNRYTTYCALALYSWLPLIALFITAWYSGEN